VVSYWLSYVTRVNTGARGAIAPMCMHFLNMRDIIKLIYKLKIYLIKIK